MPLDKPSGAPSTALTCSYLNQVKCQVHSLCHFIVHLQLLSKRTLRYHLNPSLSPPLSAPSSAASGSPLDEPFVHICALIIASKSATTGATQVQLKCTI